MYGVYSICIMYGVYGVHLYSTPHKHTLTRTNTGTVHLGCTLGMTIAYLVIQWPSTYLDAAHAAAAADRRRLAAAALCTPHRPPPPAWARPPPATEADLPPPPPCVDNGRLARLLRGSSTQVAWELAARSGEAHYLLVLLIASALGLALSPFFQVAHLVSCHHELSQVWPAL